MQRATLLASAALLVSFSLWVSASQANAQPVSEAGVEAAAIPDPEVAQAGRRLYVQNCSHCHGFNMVNPGTVSYDLRKFPLEDPDRFIHSVREGKGNMPSWKSSLTTEQITKIWAYIQTRGKL
jgi:mono/diheme cytochrome c family protein